MIDFNVLLELKPSYTPTLIENTHYLSGPFVKNTEIFMEE